MQGCSYTYIESSTILQMWPQTMQKSLGIGILLTVILIDKETGLCQKQFHASDKATYCTQCPLSSRWLEMIAEFQ